MGSWIVASSTTTLEGSLWISTRALLLAWGESRRVSFLFLPRWRPLMIVVALIEQLPRGTSYHELLSSTSHFISFSRRVRREAERFSLLASLFAARLSSSPKESHPHLFRTRRTHHLAPQTLSFDAPPPQRAPSSSSDHRRPRQRPSSVRLGGGVRRPPDRPHGNLR